MQTISKKIAFISKAIIILFLISAFLFQTGCASSYHAKKGKFGQVPCPCEKNNKRR